MKMFLVHLLQLVGAVLLSTAAGAASSSAGLRLRSTVHRHGWAEIGSNLSVLAEKDAEAPSCKVFTEMLQRIYYMRSRLDIVTDSLSTIGYKPGHEWVVDHGIGTVTPATLQQKLCPLFAGPPRRHITKAPPSLLSLGMRRAAPKEDNATVEGCAEGSPQLTFMNFLQKEFKGTSTEAKKLDAIRSIFVALLKSVEVSVTNLYSFRECPMGSGEFKTRQVCKLHREEQSKALKMVQSDLPAMRARANSLKSQVRAIKSGVSRECYIKKNPGQEPLPDRRQEYCLNVTTMTDAILDGRETQKQWLKMLGDDMQRLGIMSMQLQNRIDDPVLQQDKIPLGALEALATSWKHLEGPMQILRLTGSTRAEHAGSVDGALLGLAGLLKNTSNENGCLGEAFRLRYSAQSCKSLRAQLEVTLHERQTDLKALQSSVDTFLGNASEGLKSKNCTAAPQTEGCWHRFPSGCPKIPKWVAADKWTRDVFGEESTGSGQDAIVCLTSRKLQLDSLCGVQDTQMKFTPVEQPL